MKRLDVWLVSLCCLVWVPASASALSPDEVRTAIDEGDYAAAAFSLGAAVEATEAGAPAASEVHELEVAHSEIEGEGLVSLGGLNLPNYYLVIERAVPTRRGGTLLSGYVAKHDTGSQTVEHVGPAHLSLAGERLNGTWRTDANAYQVVPVRPRGHRLTVTALSDLPQVDDVHADEAVTVQNLAAPAPAIAAAADPLPNGNYPVDVMVLFDENAVAYNADPLGLAELFIAQGNEALTNSEVNVELRLAASSNIPQAFESFEQAFDIAASYIDAQDYRDAVGADLVALIVGPTADPDFCGRAPINATADAAVSVTEANANCVANYTFIHELGHNFGAHHNPEEGDVNEYHDDGYGLYNEELGFRTVMSYGCPGGACEPIPYFSNPDLFYEGAPLGTATQNNARVLNERAPVVADFRTPGQACDAFTDTIANHLNAGRVTSWTFWGTTRYYVVGSGESLGTDPTVVVTLVPTADGFELGDECSGGENTTTFVNVTAELQGRAILVTGGLQEGNGDTAAVLVSHVSEPDHPTLCDRTSAGFSCTLRGLPPGDYTLELRTVNSAGVYSDPSSPIDVSMPVGSAPELFDITVDTSSAGAIVIAGSYSDADGDPVVVSAEGASGSCTVLDGGTFSCEFSQLDPGDYSVVLRAVDPLNLQNEYGPFNFSVTTTPPEFVDAQASVDGNDLLVTGSLVDQGADLTLLEMQVVSFQSGFSDLYACEYTKAGSTYSFECLAPALPSGVYYYALTAQDSEEVFGNYAGPEPISVNPSTGNPPSLTIDDVLVEGLHVELGGSYTDPDGDVALVQGYIVETGEATECDWGGVSYQCMWDAPAEGAYSIEIEVQDATGLTAFETTVVSIGGTSETIIDNGDPGFSVSGSWSTSTTDRDGAKYGTDYRYDNSGTCADCTATWTPSNLDPGKYEVYMWWSPSSNRPDQAPVTLTYDTGCETSVTVNQSDSGTGDQWNLLAVVDDPLSVTLTGADSGYTIADAVRFVRVGSAGSNGCACAPPVCGGNSCGVLFNTCGSVDCGGCGAGFGCNDNVCEPEGTPETIIDNLDAGFSVSGSWGTSTTDRDGAKYGADYRYDNSGICTDCSATWTPAGLTSGRYEVYMWWSPSSNRPDQAPVTISYDTGCETNLTVSQNDSNNADVWNLLAVVDDPLAVTLSGADSGYTIADAVRFVRVGDAGSSGCSAP